MAVQLDHLIIPSRDRVAAAKLLASILGVSWAEQGSVGPFSPVYLNDGLTLDFDQWSEPIPKLHYCFRVDQDTFNAVLARLQAADIAYRSTPHGPADYQVNPAFGGSIVYWSEPDGHVWEVLTISYERQSSSPNACAA
jgi:catechol 2,3-dioxygenase-like lactoylglutathione lyase family enzyme